MKTKMKNLALGAVFLAMTPIAHAQHGDKVGGGGSFYRTLDGSLDMADRIALEPNADQEYHLSKDAVAYLASIRNLLEAYGIQSDAFWDGVFSQKAEYRYTKDDKLPCAEVFPTTDPDAVLDQYACTKGGVTYLSHAKFDSAPFPLKMLGLFHERLHAFAPGVTIENHYWITNVVSATETLVNLLKEQHQGSRRDINDDEMNTLNKMFRRAEQLGFHRLWNADDFHITKKGGGYIYREHDYNLTTPPAMWETTITNSFVGVGSNLMYAKIEDSEVLGSWITSGKVTDHSKIIGSKLRSVAVKNSTLDRGDTYGQRLKDEPYPLNSYATVITDSTINDTSFRVWSIKNSTVEGSYLQGANFIDSKFQDCILQIYGTKNLECKHSSVELSDGDKPYGAPNESHLDVTFNDSHLIDSSIDGTTFFVKPLRFNNVTVLNLKMHIEVGNLDFFSNNCLQLTLENAVLDFKAYGEWTFWPHGGGVFGNCPKKRFSNAEELYKTYHVKKD